MAYKSDLMDKEQSLITSEVAKGKTMLQIPKWFVGTLNCKEIQWRLWTTLKQVWWEEVMCSLSRNKLLIIVIKNIHLCQVVKFLEIQMHKRSGPKSSDNIHYTKHKASFKRHP